ncbi:LacI family DNA-binding transcriptional regulator, partial [Clostridioides difficile]
MNFLSITIKEIGELAGVSKTTVSKVINNKDEN